MTQTVLHPPLVVDLAEPHSPRARPKRYHWYASRYLCAITIAVIVLLCVRHVACTRLLPAYHARCKSRRKNAGTVTDTAWTVSSMLQRGYRWCILTTLPNWLYGPDTVADAIYSAVYCGLLCFFAINKSSWVGGNQNVANQMGVMAFSQLPLILLLVMKNNPISLLTGITYQKLNYLHRAASRACLLCSWIHVTLWTPRVWARGHFSHAYIISGLVALFGYTMLWTTSLRIVRRVAWEFFIVAHILFTLLFLVGAIFHWARLSYWVWPSLAIWLGDRFLRWRTASKLSRTETLATAEMLAPTTLRLTVECDALEWHAGQHAFLSFPGVRGSPHESHPFSFANVPMGADTKAVFLIKVHSGVTRRLCDSLATPSPQRIPIKVEGPYGSLHDMNSASSVLLLAGGTGVTFCLSHFVALASVPPVSGQTRHIRLLWHVRQAQDVTWILPVLEQLSKMFPRLQEFGTRIQIDFFITRVNDSRLRGSSFDRHPNCPLLPALAAVTRWHLGRADITTAVDELWRNSAGNSAVAVCGPHSLISAARTAAKLVPRPSFSNLDFYSETLGS